MAPVLATKSRRLNRRSTNKEGAYTLRILVATHAERPRGGGTISRTDIAIRIYVMIQSCLWIPAPYRDAKIPVTLHRTIKVLGNGADFFLLLHERVALVRRSGFPA